MVRISSVRLLVFGLLVAACIAACKQDVRLIVPENEPPIITLDTVISAFQGKLGEQITVPVRTADNEGLHLFRVVARRTDSKGAILWKDSIIYELGLEGSGMNFNYTYTIPANHNIYDRVYFTLYALDLEGFWDSTFMNVTVVPERYVPNKDYPIQTYTDTILFRNGKVGSGQPNAKSFFNFAGRMYAPNVNDQDIADTVRAKLTPPTYNPILRSPNNGTRDSIFVVTNPTVFNYTAATYTTIWQAFYSAAKPARHTPPLNVGDIVIMRLKLANLADEMFAVLRVKDIKPGSTLGGVNGRDDYFVFDYKYTYVKP